MSCPWDIAQPARALVCARPEAASRPLVLPRSRLATSLRDPQRRPTMLRLDAERFRRRNRPSAESRADSRGGLERHKTAVVEFAKLRAHGDCFHEQAALSVALRRANLASALRRIQQQARCDCAFARRRASPSGSPRPSFARGKRDPNVGPSVVAVAGAARCLRSAQGVSLPAACTRSWSFVERGSVRLALWMPALLVRELRLPSRPVARCPYEIAGADHVVSNSYCDTNAPCPVVVGAVKQQ